MTPLTEKEAIDRLVNSVIGFARIMALITAAAIIPAANEAVNVEQPAIEAQIFPAKKAEIFATKEIKADKKYTLTGANRPFSKRDLKAVEKKKKLKPQKMEPAPAKKDEIDIIPSSLGSAARYRPSGIYPASPSVRTSCFRPRMLTLLSAIQNKYRRPVIITSGARGIAHNASVGGVKGSLHTVCAAADIKVPGVSKYSLANFVRSLPIRGGVGLYCHNAVHVDTGTPRDWNWCRAKGGK